PRQGDGSRQAVGPRADDDGVVGPPGEPVARGAGGRGHACSATRPATVAQPGRLCHGPSTVGGPADQQRLIVEPLRLTYEMMTTGRQQGPLRPTRRGVCTNPPPGPRRPRRVRGRLEPVSNCGGVYACARATGGPFPGLALPAARGPRPQAQAEPPGQ